MTIKVSKCAEKVEADTKERFEHAGRLAQGELERMQDRIDKLEDAVAHLMGFLTDYLELTPQEIADENGLEDF